MDLLIVDVLLNAFQLGGAHCIGSREAEWREVVTHVVVIVWAWGLAASCAT